MIGASDEAELTRGPTEKNDTPEALVRDYADALVELAERYGISDIELYFIGPDCIAFQMEQPLQTLDKKQLGTLHVTAIHGLNHEQAKALSTPDSVIMFQPGFTVPDYDWSDSLKCIRDGTPFLLTSNTEMEAIADVQYLLEQDRMQELPPGLADVLEVSCQTTSDDDDDNALLAVNPFCGLRVRQNTSMANDVFCKNRWMVRGRIGPLQQPIKSTNEHKKAKSINPALV